MTDSYTAADQDGAQALDYNQHSARWQYSVQSGCDVTINSGTLGASDTLSIASGSIFFNGSSTSVSSQNAQIDSSNSDPRKDVVYLDTNGSVNVSKGTAEPKDPSGNTRFETFRPAPNDLTATDAVVLATVFVPGGATSIQSADIRDRRLFADISTQSISTEQADISNETFIRAIRSSTSNSITSGTFKNIYDGESKDVRGEFNSSAQFSPDESGEYFIVASADFRGNTADGDELIAKVQNVTDGSSTGPQDRMEATGSISSPTFVFITNLNSSKTYEIQATNGNSSFKFGGGGGAEGVIKRSVVA